MNDLGCLPSGEDLCPATPSRAPGSGLPRLHGLATAVPVVHAFEPPRESLRIPRGLGPCPRAPLPPGVTLLWTSTSFADFCNRIRRAGTPDEPSILAREWSFRSAARWHQPMPVALAAAGASPHRGPASRDPHAPAFARRVPLARTKQVTGRNTRAKASRALLTMSRVPSSWCPGHPGRRADSSSGLDDPALHRPSRDPPRMQPREGPHRRKDRGAFCRDGTLTRARDCSLVRARTAAPSRRLQRRHCSGARTPFSTALPAPSSDEESTGGAARPVDPWGPKPRWSYESQRP